MALRYLAACLVVGFASVGHAKPKIAVIPTQFDETSRGQVPKLFDDYLLGAVQNAGEFEVIGQDDIATLLGFEREKELVGCDEVSCLADIGGALGVDRIVSVKVARLGTDWVATGKVINIRTTRVESRVNEIVPGSVKDLLEAVPRLVARLFGSALPEPEPTAVSSGPTAPGRAAQQPFLAARALTPGDPSLGRGSRIAGWIISGAGFASYLATLGLAVSATCLPDTYDDVLGYYDTYSSTCDTTYAMAFVSQGFAFLGMALGSGLYLNGKARMLSGDGEASGKVWWRVFGYILMGASTAGYIAAGGSENEMLGNLSLAAGTAGTGIFALSMFLPTGKAALSDGTTVPMYASVSPTLIKNPRGGSGTPGLAFGLRF